MIYLSRTYIGIVAKFVRPSITGILWYFVQHDRLFPLCTVETMNDFMNPYIVLSEMYTESLNENYIFCVKSNIQVDNKSEQIILLCCVVFNFISDTGGRWLLSQRMAFDWMEASVKSQRNDVSCSPRVCVWEGLAGLYRWNVWFTSSVSGESGWDLKWNQSCISATEVLSQYYREGEAQAL